MDSACENRLRFSIADRAAEDFAACAAGGPADAGTDAGPAETGALILHVNGISMNVLIAGEGPDVLLVHGFPDSHDVWRNQVPALVEAGLRVIAPDTRGCGDSEILPLESDYHLDKLVADLVALLDVLGIAKVRLVAHDWGAVIGWQLAIRHPERVDRYVALSVGHPDCYAAFDPMQKLRGWYTLFFQLRGIAEWALRRRDWEALRLGVAYNAEVARWCRRLARPGRLTAGLNYYRANARLLLASAQANAVTVPVHGLWSSGDRFVTEKQMRSSCRYVRGPWCYTRMQGPNHWMQLDAPEQFNPLLLECLR